MVQGGPDGSLQLPQSCRQVGVSLFSQITIATGQEEMALSYARGRLDRILGKKILHWKGGEALEQAALGGGGITVPGGVQKTHRCGA